MENKIAVKLIGEDGNIFNLLGIVGREMKKAKLHNEFKELQQRVFKSESYDQALCIISEYVDIE